jgi:hypothetical protein
MNWTNPDSIRKVEEHLRQKAIEMEVGWAKAGQDEKHVDCDQNKECKTLK